jgi:hypothetical protein
VSNEFKRENRYIVIKRSDLAKLPKALQGDLVNVLFQINARVPARDCVVVESDWPEFEPTWAAIERRVTGPAHWDGRGLGLPPADTVCKIKRVPHGNWGEAIVRFSSNNVIVWDWADEPAINGKCTAYAHEVKCRPMRTPEQIAAEEREKAIMEMAETMHAATGFGVNRADCEALYDAGYRKQVAP